MGTQATPTNSDGMFYVVATPIGNRQDFTLRAINILKQCQHILCEDTRHSLPLLQHYDIKVPLVSLHQHNEIQRIELVVQWLSMGKTLALISDAGTPTVSDPGARLIHALHQQGYRVSPLPGACAVTAAYSVCGIDNSACAGFTFMGFLPTKPRERAQLLTEAIHAPRPVIFYEAPHRLQKTLVECQRYYPATHPLFYGREISKIYESFAYTTLQALAHDLAQCNIPSQGEWVIIIPPLTPDKHHSDDLPALAPLEISQKMQDSLAHLLPPAQLARAIHSVSGLPRQQVYKHLLNKTKT